MVNNHNPPSNSLHSEPPKSPESPAIASNGINKGNNAQPPYDSSKAFSAGDKNHRPMCKFFKRGICRNGDACHFGHAGSYETLCRFYQQGRCRYGDSCRFLHAKLPPVNNQGDEEDTDETEEDLTEEEFESEEEMEDFPELDVSLILRRMAMYRDMTEAEVAEDMEQRMRNCGFNDDEVEDLLCQGVKPYDSDAGTVLAFLQGDWEDHFMGYDSGEDDYDDGFWGLDGDDEDEAEDEDEKHDVGASEDSGTDED